ncbi:hypothetical protein HK101_001484, partial [Irineochytrium annulatum]
MCRMRNRRELRERRGIGATRKGKEIEGAQPPFLTSKDCARQATGATGVSMAGAGVGAAATDWLGRQESCVRGSRAFGQETDVIVLPDGRTHDLRLRREADLPALPVEQQVMAVAEYEVGTICEEQAVTTGYAGLTPEQQEQQQRWQWWYSQQLRYPLYHSQNQYCTAYHPYYYQYDASAYVAAGHNFNPNGVVVPATQRSYVPTDATTVAVAPALPLHT